MRRSMESAWCKHDKYREQVILENNSFAFFHLGSKELIGWARSVLFWTEVSCWIFPAMAADLKEAACTRSKFQIHVTQNLLHRRLSWIIWDFPASIHAVGVNTIRRHGTSSSGRWQEKRLSWVTNGDIEKPPNEFVWYWWLPGIASEVEKWSSQWWRCRGQPCDQQEP